MPIKEDSILEALCEKSSIEPQTSINHKRGFGVTKKERNRMFNKFASQSDLGRVFWFIEASIIEIYIPVDK